MTNNDHTGDIKKKRVYPVLWKGEYCKAEICAERLNTETHNKEYYVHYIGYDLRLDEWVGTDRIDWSQPDSNAKSVTASQINDAPSEKSDRKTREGRKMQASEVVTENPSLSSVARGHKNSQASAVQVRNIEAIVLGQYEISTWYYSPYPDEYGEVSRLYICEFCLKYMKTQETYANHLVRCEFKHPPGKQIYAHSKEKIFEIDGKVQKLYCQNLCLLAKLFLDHKTLFYDAEGFLFYVLTEQGEDGRDHIAAYFSKEKISYDNYNLACILTLPPYQRKGYGRLLIEFSYELSKLERKLGSPERPLSDLGLRSFQSFWAGQLLRVLRERTGEVSISELSHLTAMRVSDVVSTLRALGLLRYTLTGDHISAHIPSAAATTKSGRRHGYGHHTGDEEERRPVIVATRGQIEGCIQRYKIRVERLVHPELIEWRPPGVATISET
ncbi:uncharacterized protein VTP21DRAFT_1270 [Calcarisporiella thermophila]|uniref:uncharacterized protein n=1 Tax=Calcarisporiella thermophila TaxID=911321 RepID=UPI003742A04E